MIDLYHVEDADGQFLSYAEGGTYAKCLQAAEHWARRLQTEVYITQYEGEGAERVTCYTITPDEE